MLYAAKCYWPGVTGTSSSRSPSAPSEPAGPRTATGVVYLGSLLFSADDLVLCLFEGPSRTAVIRASDRLGIPRERLMDSLWIGPAQSATEGIPE